MVIESEFPDGDEPSGDQSGRIDPARFGQINPNANSVTANDTTRAEEEKLALYPDTKKSAVIRSEELKDIFSVLAKAVLIVLAILLLLIIIIRVAHMLTHECRHWLSEKQIEQIDQLFSYLIIGSVSGSLLKYFQSNIGLDEKKED